MSPASEATAGTQGRMARWSADALAPPLQEATCCLGGAGGPVERGHGQPFWALGGVLSHSVRQETCPSHRATVTLDGEREME